MSFRIFRKSLLEDRFVSVTVENVHLLKLKIPFIKKSKSFFEEPYFC